jgi:hypothetical protein
LIYISDVRKGKKLPEGLSEKDYNRLDEYIKSCCGLICNLAATLEWVEGNATENSASEIAAVVDSAKLKFLQADRSLESKVFSKVSDALNALENGGFAW